VISTVHAARTPGAAFLSANLRITPEMRDDHAAYIAMRQAPLVVF
jgi:hypothetical protein